MMYKQFNKFKQVFKVKKSGIRYEDYEQAQNRVMEHVNARMDSLLQACADGSAPKATLKPDPKDIELVEKYEKSNLLSIPKIGEFGSRRQLTWSEE